MPSSFIGRRQDVAHVASLLSRSRLVTLTGPGGMGKTRLAIQVAIGLTPAFVDGVWLVELGALTDAEVLPEAVAVVLPGIRSDLGPQLIDDLATHIGEKSMLLVLDNCEQMVEGCGHVVDVLLRRCPRLRVLATSREPLGVGGEHRWSVGSLSLPESVGCDAAALRASEAGELFVQRATEAFSDFQLTEAMAATVSDICRRLDGMPLAIELAAARLTSLSPTDVLERLDDRFRLLATDSRTVAARHQTLAATLEWSHDLLSPAEARLLRRLSIFAGWTLEAAEEVCAGPERPGRAGDTGPERPGRAGDTGPDLQREEVVDLLARLVSKSLVIVETRGDRLRYSFLETIRAWARLKLEAASEAAAMARRHAAWSLGLAQQADGELGGSRPRPWLDLLDAEHDNFRAALEWARESDDRELGVQLAVALATFWRTRGNLREGLGWLEWAVAAGDECPIPLRAMLLRKTGLLRGMLGDITGALPLLEESSALFADCGDHDASLCTCSSTFHMFRNPRQSLPGLEENVDRCRRAGGSSKLAHFLWALGQGYFLLGELPDARRHFEESVQLGRGDADGEALRSALFGLGRVAVLLGEHDAAEAAFGEARTQAEELGDVDDVATALGLLGDLARVRGDWDGARRLLSESMRLSRAGNSPGSVARAMYFSARLAEAESSDGSGAGALFEEALSLGRAGGAPSFHEARCLLGIGSAAQADGSHSIAAGHFLEALATAQAIEDKQATAQAFDRLSRVARLDGRLDEADTLARRGWSSTTASAMSPASPPPWTLWPAWPLIVGVGNWAPACWLRPGPPSTRWRTAVPGRTRPAWSVTLASCAPLWARRSFPPCAMRAPRCRWARRLSTRGRAPASAFARPAAGTASPRPSTRSRAWWGRA